MHRKTTSLSLWLGLSSHANTLLVNSRFFYVPNTMRSILDKCDANQERATCLLLFISAGYFAWMFSQCSSNRFGYGVTLNSVCYCWLCHNELDDQEHFYRLLYKVVYFIAWTILFRCELLMFQASDFFLICSPIMLHTPDTTQSRCCSLFTLLTRFSALEATQRAQKPNDVGKQSSRNE